MIVMTQLKHIEHLEDCMMNEGSDGLHKAEYILYDILYGMECYDPDWNKKVAVKADGAPAIVAGIDPRNNKFFVATKSIYNKTPKYNYSVEDIKKNHSKNPRVIEILKHCLVHLRKTIKKGMYQGDLMYINEASSFSLMFFSNEVYLTFTPNTITYAVKDELKERILESEMGVAWHTTCKGDPDNIETVSGVDHRNFADHKHVWNHFTTFDRKEYKGFTGETYGNLFRDVEMLRRMNNELRANNHFKEFMELELNIYFKKWINHKFREGFAFTTLMDEIEDFRAYVDPLHTTPELMNRFFHQQYIFLSLLMGVYFETMRIKNEIIHQILNTTYDDKGIKCFFKQKDEYIPCSPEGFVVSYKYNKNDSIIIKLVDRSEFSARNFANMNWK